MKQRSMAISLGITGAVLASVIFLLSRKHVPTFSEAFISINRTSFDQYHLTDVTSVNQLAKEISDRYPDQEWRGGTTALVYFRTASGYFRVEVQIRGTEGRYGFTKESMVSEYPELNKIIRKDGWKSLADVILIDRPELSWTRGVMHSNIDVFRDGTFKPTHLAWLRRKLGL